MAKSKAGGSTVQPLIPKAIEAVRPARVVALATAVSDADTVALFEKLAEQASNSELVGAIVIPVYRRSGAPARYSMHLAGLAEQNPTFAAGAMSACQVLVQELALQQAELL